MNVLFAAQDFSRFSSMVATLGRNHDIELVPAATGQLDDMSGIAFVNQAVKVNPLVNTALVSELAADAFHEATEGLGVLMQLPARPRQQDAEALLVMLEKIGALMQPGVHA